MKLTKRIVPMTVAAMLMCCTATVFAIDQCTVLLEERDSEGEEVCKVSAVAFSDGQIVAGDSPEDEDNNFFLVTPDGEYEAEYSGNHTWYNVIDSHRGDKSFLRRGQPKMEDQTAVLCYYTSNVEYHEVNVDLKNFRVDSSGTIGFDIEGYDDYNVVYPAAVMSGSKCIGVAVGDEEGAVVWDDDQGVISKSYIVIAAILALIAGLVLWQRINSKKKKVNEQLYPPGIPPRNMGYQGMQQDGMSQGYQGMQQGGVSPGYRGMQQDGMPQGYQGMQQSFSMSEPSNDPVIPEEEYFARNGQPAGGPVEDIPPTVAVPEHIIRIMGNGGEMDGRIFTLSSNSGGALVFGRNAGVNVRYSPDAKGISREHCRLYISGGNIMLADLGSSYGTVVNGKGKLTPNVPVVLKRGDTFFVGNSQNQFRIC